MDGNKCEVHPLRHEPRHTEMMRRVASWYVNPDTLETECQKNKSLTRICLAAKNRTTMVQCLGACHDEIEQHMETPLKRRTEHGIDN